MHRQLPRPLWRHLPILGLDASDEATPSGFAVAAGILLIHADPEVTGQGRATGPDLHRAGVQRWRVAVEGIGVDEAQVGRAVVLALVARGCPPVSSQ